MTPLIKSSSSAISSNSLTLSFESPWGDIIDRNGNKLAVSRKVYDLVLDPVLILTKNTKGKEAFVEPTGAALKKVFGISESKFQN